MRHVISLLLMFGLLFALTGASFATLDILGNLFIAALLTGPAALIYQRRRPIRWMLAWSSLVGLAMAAALWYWVSMSDRFAVGDVVLYDQKVTQAGLLFVATRAVVVAAGVLICMLIPWLALRRQYPCDSPA